MDLERLEELIAAAAKAPGGPTLTALRSKLADALVPTDELRLAVDTAHGTLRSVELQPEDPHPWY